MPLFPTIGMTPTESDAPSPVGVLQPVVHATTVDTGGAWRQRPARNPDVRRG